MGSRGMVVGALVGAYVFLDRLKEVRLCVWCVCVCACWCACINACM